MLINILTFQKCATPSEADGLSTLGLIMEIFFLNFEMTFSN